MTTTLAVRYVYEYVQRNQTLISFPRLILKESTKRFVICIGFNEE